MLHKMKRYREEKVDPFGLSTSPGILAGFYFSCGPVAGLGFWIGNWQGFVFAILGNTMFWILISLLEAKYK